MVSSCHYLATFAGARMFELGGNAIDAGVAAGIALNVLERHLTDFGGVAPIVVFRPGMDAPETIDGLGHWPASLDLDTYRATHGDDMPIGVARSVTPAAADAWLTALARHGRLSLAEVLAPSIELCDGFPVYPRLAAIERAHQSRGRSDAIMAARDAIYLGDIADQIASFMREAGGAITSDDLRAQRVRIEAPAHSTYRGIDVYACGPWSQGPLVPMTLNLLEGFDVAGMGPGTLEFLHRY